MSGQAVDMLILWVTFVPALAFTLVYGLAVRWWASPEGVNLFGFTLAFTLLAGRAVLLRTTADDPQPSGWVIRGIVLLLAAFLWQRLALLVIRQHQRDR